MSKPKFTPGPWRADYDPMSSGKRNITRWRVLCGEGLVAHDLSPEDARLFAAAPEMYEAGEEALAALYGAREALGDVANISHAIRLLEAAQDKARGEAGK